METLKNLSWLVLDADAVLVTIFSTILIYLTIIILTRINGLRTFAKMSSFDFSITIAIGSIIASTIILEDQSVLKGIISLIILLLLQTIMVLARKKNKTLQKILTNQPVMLMNGGEIIHHNMKKAKIAESDLFAKLRSANITNLDQVIAVVLETTGDMSILHTGKPGISISPKLLEGVSRYE